MNYKEFKDDYGFMCKEWRNEHGKLHRAGGPAYTRYDYNNSVDIELFAFNGVKHREDGPAEIIYYSNGIIRLESFFLNGIRHREDGPAYVCYNLDGSISFESFYLKKDYFGFNKEGFWNFWDRLTKEQRQAPSILTYLARYL
jgi:hypothetical protein